MDGESQLYCHQNSRGILPFCDELRQYSRSEIRCQLIRVEHIAFGRMSRQY